MSVDFYDAKVRQAAESIASGLTGLLVWGHRSGESPNIADNIDEARQIFQEGIQSALELMVMPKGAL